jgi:flagellar hook-basal body complex protein FliE
MIYEKLGGRKAIMTILIVGIGALVDILAKSGLSQNLLSLLGIALGAFVTGNGIEHAANAIKARKVQKTESTQAAAAPAPSVDLEPINDTLNQLAKESQQLAQGYQALSNRVAVAEQSAKTAQQTAITLANKLAQYE